MIGHNLVACCIRNFLRSQIGLSDNHHQLILMEPQTSQINSSQLQDENLTYLVRTAGNKRPDGAGVLCGGQAWRARGQEAERAAG